MKKRGSSQVDWAISLAIFILYIAWFFILARPQISQESDIGSLASYMIDSVEENSSWRLTKIPAFITASEAEALAPLIIDFPLGWENASFAFVPDKNFLLDEEKLYTVHSTTEGTYPLWLAHSDSTYALPSFSKDLDATADYARVSSYGFEVLFYNSSPYTMSYDGNLRIHNYTISVNDDEIDLANHSHTLAHVVAKYKLVSDLLDQTSLVFPEHPRIILQYNLDALLPQSVNLDFITDPYPSYYFNGAELGSFNYSSTSCVNTSSLFLDLYSFSDGVSFRSEKELSFSLCTNNASHLSVNAEIVTDEDFMLIIEFHDGDYSTVLNKSLPVFTGYGASSRVSGLKLERLEALEAMDYESIRNLLNFPANTEFSITLQNRTTTLIDIKDEEPLATENVIVEQKKVQLLKSDGTLVPYTLRVRVW